MPKRITNTDLARKVDEGFAQSNKRIDKVEDKMQTFHDFMIVQKDRQMSRKSNGALDWQGIIKQALTVMVIAGSIVLLVIQIIAERLTS